VHQHGGRITFTSREGEGSVFRIELPRGALPEAGADREEQEPAASEPTSETRR
jgi:nitrogen-specific signal transduction histidine kinase